MSCDRIPLCPLADIADGAAKGVEPFDDPYEAGLILLRAGDDVCAYRNRCPHQGTPLETFPDRFLDSGTGLIVCSTHGARFRVSDGLCVSGPCKGEKLEAVPVETREGIVCLAPARGEK